MDIDPCGFAVDILRSCYTTDARLIHFNTRESKIIWYFVDTPFLPFRTSINSLNWVDYADRHNDTSFIGEIGGRPRPWYNGKAPDRPLGTQPCGNPAWFVLGSPLRMTPRPAGPDGWPFCCLPPVGMGWQR